MENENASTEDASTEPVHHVSRSEFDELKSVVDGLAIKVTEIVPPVQGDDAPGGKPWTHWGSR